LKEYDGARWLLWDFGCPPLKGRNAPERSFRATVFP
jgi:hypothetical protein